MDDILNKYGLPNEIGFEISIRTFKSLLKNDAYDKLRDVINEIYNRVTSSIGLDESINLGISMDFTVKFKDGKKSIAMDEYSIIKSIYNYFNTEYAYQNDVHFGLKNNQKLLEEIQKLKDFLREKIKELRSVNDVSQLKNISNALYESYMLGYNQKVKKEKFTLLYWNKFFQSELNLDIERFMRLRTWLENFIADLTISLPFELFSDIDVDKTKLFFATQFLFLSVVLEDPNRSILIRNSIELVESIDDPNVYIDKVFLWGASESKNDTLLQRIEYKRIDLGLPLELIEKFLHHEMVQKSVDVLLKYSSKDFENKDIHDVYDNINKLIQNALNESSKIGSKDVNLDDLKTEAVKKLNSSDNKDNQLKLKSFIDRVDTFLHYLKPFKVQDGAGKFKGFHVFYYENGMVVLDKLNGAYASLYVMPVMVYLSILKNETLKNLYDVRNFIGVRTVSHRKSNWQDAVKVLIDSHQITPEEIEILDRTKDVALPVGDEDLQTLKERYKDNQYLQEEIREKELERQKRFEEIDEEVKNNNAIECEKNLLDDEEDKIIEEINDSNDFLTINDASVQSSITRNPKVSLFTKIRTKDERGAMHCDMCGEFASFDTRNFEAHHIIPLSVGGIDNVYNTVCLCGNCHNKIHSKLPPTMYETGKMLERVRERIKNTTPYYLQKFDRLFNPNYNAIYGSDDYQKETEYYENNKIREDRNFLIEWNSRK